MLLQFYKNRYTLSSQSSKTIRSHENNTGTPEWKDRMCPNDARNPVPIQCAAVLRILYWYGTRLIRNISSNSNSTSRSRSMLRSNPNVSQWNIDANITCRNSSSMITTVPILIAWECLWCSISTRNASVDTPAYVLTTGSWSNSSIPLLIWDFLKENAILSTPGLPTADRKKHKQAIN